ncbi:MAG: hypothetical protein ACREP1_00090 [Rhodanobacteraceae bacterium]
MKVVLASGEILVVTEEQPELLQAMRSSYGLLGAIFEVTFRVKPLQRLAFHHESFTLDEFERQLPALVARGDSLMYYLYPFQDRVTVESHQLRSKLFARCFAALRMTTPR